MSWFVGLFVLSNVARAFIKTIRAMTATRFATIPTLQMVAFGKNTKSFGTEIKIFAFFEIIRMESVIHTYKINNFARMKVIVAKYLTPVGFRAITIFPFVIVRSKDALLDPHLLSHERIHIHQQRELLVVFFYVWYVLEFLGRWMVLRDRTEAYRAISFEREAYANENDPHYLKRRSLYSFLFYFKK